MIERKRKECKECQTQQYLFSKGRCQGCWQRTQKPLEKKVVSLKRTPIKRTRLKQKPRKATGELEVFKTIWENRPHVCQVTNQAVTEDTVNFSHILPKGRYPEARLDPNNIWIVHWEVHHKWEHGDRLDTMFAKKREAFQKLKTKYDGLQTKVNRGVIE